MPSIGEPSRVSPKKFFICPIIIAIESPAENPVVMVIGMYFTRDPSFRTPIRIRITPAIIVAIIRPSTPSVATIPATTVIKAAVGPETLTLLPPRRAIIKPAMTDV